MRFFLTGFTNPLIIKKMSFWVLRCTNSLFSLVKMVSHNGCSWQWPLEVIWFYTPAQAGPCRTGCPTSCPDRFRISPRTKTPQPLCWAICSSIQSPSQLKSISWCSEGLFCVSVCAHWLLSCHWEPLKGTRLCPFYNWAFSPPGWSPGSLSLPL